MTARDSNITNFFETTLDSAMGPTDLTATVASTTGAPGSPAYFIIEPENANQREVIYFDGTFTATSLVTTTIDNRYLSGSAAGSGLTHPSGSVVWVAVVGQHIEDLHDRVDGSYRPGGTDVAVADGGTGASTAAGARSNLAVVGTAGGTMSGDLNLGGNTLVDHTVDTNNQTGTSYTLAAADTAKVLEFNNASAVTVTVPPNSSVGFDVGTIIELWQQGAGQVTVAAGAGVTIRSPGGLLALDGQYASATLRKRATDEWTLEGRLA